MIFFYFVSLCLKKNKILNNIIKTLKKQIFFYIYTDSVSHKCLLMCDANASLGFCRYLLWKVCVLNFIIRQRVRSVISGSGQ